jgi:hypothetical protein
VPSNSNQGSDNIQAAELDTEQEGHGQEVCGNESDESADNVEEDVKDEKKMIL